VPIVAYFLSEGLMWWSKQIAGGSFESVEAVKFHSSFHKFAVVLDKLSGSSLTIMILTTNGYLSNRLKEVSSGAVG